MSGLAPNPRPSDWKPELLFAGSSRVKAENDRKKGRYDGKMWLGASPRSERGVLFGYNLRETSY